MIKAILATGLNGEIGQNGDMPWGKSLPKDLEYFKKVTLYQDVVVGRNTYETLPFNQKGFPQRDTLVLTSKYDDCILNNGEAVYFMSKGELLDLIKTSEYDIWIAGGSAVYEQFWDLVDEVHITTVHKTYPEADTYSKPDLSNFEKVGEEIDVGNGELEAIVQVWRRVQ